MATIVNSPLDTTLQKTLARIQGKNPEKIPEEERVRSINRSNDLTLESIADIMSRTPEAQKAGLTPSDFFTYLVNNGHRMFMNQQSVEDMKARGMKLFNTPTDWADSIVQTLGDRLQTTPASHPILGPQVDFKGPPNK